MLKIKDNVDLKELEKFGLSPRYDYRTGKITKYTDIDEKCIIVDKERKIEILVRREEYNNYIDKPAYNILFDIIQADLVEKVEE